MNSFIWSALTSPAARLKLSIAMPIGLRMAFSMLALIGPMTAVAPAIAQTTGSKSPDLAEVTRLIVRHSNEFRRAEGANAINPDAKLAETARSFANYMARTDRYGHEADGKQPAERAHQHGYEYCIVLENIASLYNSAGFDTRELAERVVQGWKASPGHRKNMLDADVTDIGVAIARSERSQRYFVVQMFGRPQAKGIEFRIANASPAAIDYELDGKAFALPVGATRIHKGCRPQRLTMRLPGEPQATTFEPGNGERYEVESVGPNYRLKKS